MDLSPNARLRLAAILVLGCVVLPASAAQDARDAAREQVAWNLPVDADTPHRRAIDVCGRLEADGRSDWRLPTPDELDRLAARAGEGDEEAAALVASLRRNAAWTREVSDSGLVWAAAFAHGYRLRIHERNWIAVRALCVAGPEPEETDAGDRSLAEGPWKRPLDLDTDSPLSRGCAGEVTAPEIVKGSVAAFDRIIPANSPPVSVPADFVVNPKGRTQWVAPAPGSSDRFGGVTISLLDTFKFTPATCDGEKVPAFFHLDFGQTAPDGR